MYRFSALLLVCLIVAGDASNSLAQSPLRNALTVDNVDWEQCAAFVDGKLSPAPAKEQLAPWLGIGDHPSSSPRWSTGAAAGEVRHFRIVFKSPVEIGTVCSPAEDVAALKRDAPLPGDVTDDKQWEKIPGGNVRTLPPGTQVRALRVTVQQYNLPWEAVKRASDFPGVWLFKERYFNPAEVGFQRWSNSGAGKQAASLSWLAYWPEPLSIDGCVIALPGAPDASLAALPADAKVHPRSARAEDWQSLATNAAPSVIAANAPVTTQSLRLTLAPLPKGESPPHVYALVKLPDDAPAPTARRSFVPAAPVALEYEMPLDGFVAVRIEDEQGRHVRRLIAEVERPRGKVMEGWDLLDDQGRMVPPGNYHFTGIARPPLKLTYEMTVYSAGNPPWMAPVPGGGWWMADHAPPTSVCAVGETMFFGAAGAEFGAPLIATDREGRKLWHDLHQGALRLVSDGRYAYVVNDQEIVRIDPQASFAKQTLHKFAYSADLPGHANAWVHADHSGAAIYNGALCVSYSASAPPWIRSTFSAAQVDIPKCQPSPLPRKVHETALTPDETIHSTFQTTVSSTQAAFGPVVKKGPLQHCLLLTLKSEVPLGSVLVPAADIEVYALNEGAQLPADFVRGTTPDDPLSVAGGKEQPSALEELSVELGGRFDAKTWTTLRATKQAGPAIVTPGKGMKTKALVFRSPKLQQLDYSLALDRRYKDVVGDAQFVALEGVATKEAVWTFQRGVERPLSYGQPAVAGYIWKEPINARGFVMTRPMPWAGVAIDVWEGPEDVTLDKDAFTRDEHWRQVALHRQTRNDIKWSWHTQRIIKGDFGATLQTRGVRVRVIDPPQGPSQKPGAVHGGFESLLVLSPIGDDVALPKDLAQRVTVLDLPKDATGSTTVRCHLPIPHPSALAFDKSGKLYVACDEGVCRLASLNPADIDRREVVLTRQQAGRPRAMAFNSAGELVVLDAMSGIVRVFDLASKQVVRQFGKPGPKLGKYDPQELSNAVALSIDNRDKLWLVEQSFQPKRITRWSADGQIEKEFYGPTHYGGGGMLDPRDKSVINHLGMKFRIDYKTRQWKLESRLAHYSSGEFLPDRVTYVKDHRFLVGDRPVVTPFGDAGPTAVICQEIDGAAVPRVVTGLLGDWRELPKNAALQQAAARIDPSKTAFVWCDRNADQRAQVDEVLFVPNLVAKRAPFIGDDLSLNFVDASGGTRLRISEVLLAGNSAIPTYDLTRIEKVPELTAETMVNAQGETFVMAHKLLGSEGHRLWSYPDNYIGVQASNMVPWGFTGRPAGVICGSLCPVGHFTMGDESIFCVSSNNGDYYALTRDGLLVASILGGPKGYGRRYFSMADCVPGETDLSDLRKTVEDFHGHVTRAEDGHVYAIAGKNHVTLMRVDGLEQMQRVHGTVKVSERHLQQTQQWSARKAQMERFMDEDGPKRSVVAFAKKPLEVDGDILTDWPAGDPVTIRQSLSATGSIAEQWQARLAFDKDHLYIGGTAMDDSPLVNSAEDPAVVFQHGDALDLHLGLDKTADAARTETAAGDIRLVMTYRGDEPVVMLYRYVTNAAAAPQREFVSPVGKTVVAEIRELTDAKVAVVRNNRRWTLEVAIPWKALGATAPAQTQVLRGDFGALVSDPQGRTTVARHYWANKRHVIMGDQPAEARLLPGTWGEFEFQPASELDALLDGN